MRFLWRRRLKNVLESGGEPRPLRRGPRFRIVGIALGVVRGLLAAMLAPRLRVRTLEESDADVLELPPPATPPATGVST